MVSKSNDMEWIPISLLGAGWIRHILNGDRLTFDDVKQSEC